MSARRKAKPLPDPMRVAMAAADRGVRAGRVDAAGALEAVPWWTALDTPFVHALGVSAFAVALATLVFA